ncbi:MAG: flagellar hook-associated protein FlgL [Deltaproteobacteria bacterium]|nr:flagellar hook-associated protein FlgL [Deltaproteobacteria bacterium]MBW2069697.1 flagellar hook-associated protein FlgL [Deltaproteobacteria bacterium]
MKVATRTVYDQIIQTLFRQTERLQDLNQVVSSGKRISSPADDPPAAALALDIKGSLSELQQYSDNINEAKAQLQASESIIDHITQVLTRAKEIAVQMASETSSAENRRIAAAEVWHLSEEVMQAVNFQQNGVYVFSGFQTDQQAVGHLNSVADVVAHQQTGGDAADITVTWDPLLIDQTFPSNPYLIEVTAVAADKSTISFRVSNDGGTTWAEYNNVASGTDVNIAAGMDVNFDVLGGSFQVADRYTVPIHHYEMTAGDDAVEVHIGRNAKVTKNVTASGVLELASGKSVLDILDELRAALLNNNTEAIGSSLVELAAAQDKVLDEAADVGARLERLDVRETLNDSLGLFNKERLSQVEDADIVAAITQLKNQQLAYEAALQSATMITRITLLDYL